MLDLIPAKREIETAAKFFTESKDNPERYPTDEEVLACEKTFLFLLDLACVFHLEMLSSWAANQHMRYNSIAYTRKLK